MSAKVSQKLTTSANRVVMLCARAANLRYADEARVREEPLLRAGNLLDAWKSLWNELHGWHDDRPREFHSILETPASMGSSPAATTTTSEEAFRMIIFTTAGAMFASQLYHTALLLLLQCKPRTMRMQQTAAAAQHPTSTSPLWHAQRICSIAMSNNGRASWHPTLLASFLLAAKYLTHASQQGVILEHFARVKALTRWNFDEDVRALKEYWSMSEGT